MYVQILTTLFCVILLGLNIVIFRRQKSISNIFDRTLEQIKVFSIRQDTIMSMIAQQRLEQNILISDVLRLSQVIDKQSLEDKETENTSYISLATRDLIKKASVKAAKDLQESQDQAKEKLANPKGARGNKKGVKRGPYKKKKDTPFVIVN